MAKKIVSETVRLNVEADKSEAQRLIRIVAGPELATETTKSRIARTVQILGWTMTRVRNVWHRAAHRIDAHEMDQLRAITQGKLNKFSTRNASEDSDSC